MIKRILAILLCCCLVSFAETVTIKKASQLIEWFNTHSGDDTSQVVIELADDLNFQKAGLKYPLGFSQGSCNPFSGSFKGREHRIKKLVMDNKHDSTYSSAGLFCGLKGAIVDDLIIDSSCIFTGVSAGALSVTITGENTVSLLNVENEAIINGDHGVGGLIGFVDNKVGGKVSFERCKNTGIVTASENDAGGLIGHVKNCKSTSVEFHNVTNDGIINGAQVAGGLIGFFKNNDDVKVSVNKSINEKIIKGKNYAGGLLGYVERATENNEYMVYMTNNIIKGIVQGTNMACGFFCSVDSESDSPFSCVFNSINSGVTSGSNAYGFAPYVTQGSNDVSLGKVNGTHYSASFWKSAKAIDTIVTTKELCKNCDGAVWAVKKADGSYDVMGTKMHVHDMLNWNVMNGQAWKWVSFWNSKLGFQEDDDGDTNFGNSLTISFTAISFVFLVMIHGVFSQ